MEGVVIGRFKSHMRKGGNLQIGEADFVTKMTLLGTVGYGGPFAIVVGIRFTIPRSSLGHPPKFTSQHTCRGPNLSVELVTPYAFN